MMIFLWYIVVLNFFPYIQEISFIPFFRPFYCMALHIIPRYDISRADDCIAASQSRYFTIRFFPPCIYTPLVGAWRNCRPWRS